MYIQVRLNLIKIIEGIKKKKTTIIIKKTPHTKPLLKILLNLGYVIGFQDLESDIKVFLKYNLFGNTFNLSITNKVFLTKEDIVKMIKFNPRVTFILFTNRGVIFSNKSLQLSSGFLLAELY